METYAFQYGLKRNLLNFWARKLAGKVPKLPMKYLFHNIAGTSTGAILSATLAVQNDKSSNNSYYASDVINFFMRDGP
jgi:patatin-like phospholipase/acyl hydrolase